MFYNYDRINSYDALFNFIMTNRGYGKTYGAKIRGIKRFLKYGEQMIYVRRYKSELKKIKKFFNDVKHEFPEHTFKVEGTTFYINGVECGCAIPLSTSLNEKSVPYPEVTTVIFDEFLVPTGYIRYLNDEVTVLLELVFTIIRLRDNLKVYFLANNISSINPYFTYFDLQVPEGDFIKLYKDGTIAIEKSTNEVFIEKVSNTRFGKLIAGTKYADYSIGNKSLVDTNTFIEPKPLKNMFNEYRIKCDGVILQVSSDKKTGKHYVHDKEDKSTPLYTIDTVEHDELSMLGIKQYKTKIFALVIYDFQFGVLTFKNQQVKHVMYKILKKLGVS